MRSPARCTDGWIVLRAYISHFLKRTRIADLLAGVNETTHREADCCRRNSPEAGFSRSAQIAIQCRLTATTVAVAAIS